LIGLLELTLFILFSFLNWFFFQFHPPTTLSSFLFYFHLSILDCLRIVFFQKKISLELSWFYGFNFFFLDFKLQQWICQKWSFIICFYFFMKLAQSHDLKHRFNMLAWVVIVVPFFNLFFYLILQHMVDWKLGFVFFYLIFMGLSWSHDLGYGFGRLTQLTWVVFFIFYLIFFLIVSFNVWLIRKWVW
jgi:hypothetical protein